MRAWPRPVTSTGRRSRACGGWCGPATPFTPRSASPTSRRAGRGTSGCIRRCSTRRCTRRRSPASTPAAAGRPEVPFSFSGVRLHRRGAGSLHVRVTGGERSWRVVATDEDGTPVASVEALETRPLDASRLATRRGRPRRAVRGRVDAAAGGAEAGRAAAGGARRGPAGSMSQASWRSSATRTCRRSAMPSPRGRRRPSTCWWRSSRRRAGELPEAAHASRPGRSSWSRRGWPRIRWRARGSCSSRAARWRWPIVSGPDLRQAPLPGLLRSAQSEHPDRFALIDSDGGELSDDVLSAALASGEPELALREGALLVPRLQHFGGGDALPCPRTAKRVARVAGDARHAREPAHRVPSAGGGTARPRARCASPSTRPGLNFRDVAVALGVVDVPDNAIGAEGAGVVTEVGARGGGAGPGRPRDGPHPRLLRAGRGDRPAGPGQDPGWLVV